MPHEPFDRLARCLTAVLASLPAGERERRTSLMAAPATTWIRELLAAWTRERGRLPSEGRKQDLSFALRRCYRLLCFAYDTRDWWEREIWDLQLDPRIPRREHEPNWRGIDQPYLSEDPLAVLRTDRVEIADVIEWLLVARCGSGVRRV